MTKRKRAMSTILTTVIILVASVVLGSGVVLYGTTLFQGRTQTEAIVVQGLKVWVDPTDTNGLGWGAVGVRNSGDKIVSFDKISVRGTDIPFTSWYADTNQTRITSANFQSSYLHSGTYISGGQMADSGTAPACTSGATNVIIDQDGTGGEDGMCLEARTGPVSLASGDRVVVYFRVANGTLNTLDSGGSTSVNVFAGAAGAPQSITIGNP